MSAPINSYQEFSKIFNPKSVGRESGGGSFVYSKNNRKSSYENNNGNPSTFGGSHDDTNLLGIGPSGKQ